MQNKAIFEIVALHAEFHEIGFDPKTFNFQKYNTKRLQQSEDSVLILKPGHNRNDFETLIFLSAGN